MVAVGALGGVIIALLVLLLLYASAQLAQAVGQMIPKLPIIGTRLRDVVIASAYAVVTYAERVFDAAVEPAARFILAPVLSVQNLLSRLVQGISEAVTTSEWLVDTYVPREVGAVQTWAYGRILNMNLRLTADVHALTANIGRALTESEAYTDAAAGALAARLSADLGAITDRLHATVAAILAREASDVGALAARLSADLGAITDRLHATAAALAATEAADVHALTARITHETATLTAAITAAESAAVTRAVTAVDTEAATAAAAVAAAVDGAVAGAIDAAGDGFADIVAGLRAIDWSRIADVAGATAATGAVAVTLSRYLEQCGVPNCRNLSGLGRDLQSVLGLVEGAGLLAALTDLVTDPHGAAEFLAHDVAPTVTGLAHSAARLVGAA